MYQLHKMFTAHSLLLRSNVSICAVREMANAVIVPRMGGMIVCDTMKIPYKILMGVGESWAIDRAPFYDLAKVLNNNQKTVLRHLLKTVYSPPVIKAGKSSCVVCMPPGYGKTYLAIGLIVMFTVRTFIIVPNSSLLDQWVAELTKFFSAIPEAARPTIGKYGGGKKDDADITVGIVNSSLNYNFSKVDLVIFDEVHMYTSPIFANIFFTAQAPLILGMTATPNSRLDGFEKVFNWHLGATIDCQELEGWDPADVIFTTKVLKVAYKGAEEYTKCLYSDTGELSFPLMVNQLVADPTRNTLIAEHARALYHEGRNVYVFSDRLSHLIEIDKLLGMPVDYEVDNVGEDGVGNVDDVEEAEDNANSVASSSISNVVSLKGGASKEEIAQARGVGRIILTTYKYSGTGLSISKMNAIILATPRKSNLTQIVGRIYRLDGDASIQRIIVDVVDVNTPMKRQYPHRKKTYERLGADIISSRADIISCRAAVSG